MLRRVRLVAGLVLFAYVTTHLLNAALGLVSFEAMNDGRHWFLLLWRSVPGTVALYGAVLTHVVLAFWAIYARRTLALRPSEACQLALGLALPYLIALHVVGTRGAAELAGTRDNYTYVLLAHFVFDHSLIWLQVGAVLTAWVHGCIGLHAWLRLKPGYEAAKPMLYAIAVLIPMVALLGYFEGGREVMELAADPVWRRETIASLHFADRETAALLYHIEYAVFAFVAGGVAIALAARGVRAAHERVRGVIRVSYPDDRAYAVRPGLSILDVSRANGVPHASVCGGRGRCSTCRVRVTDGIEQLPPPSPAELRVLERIGRPVNVRLACQTYPVADVAVVPLLPPDATPKDGFRRANHHQGQEREVAVLFTDLRSFTRFSEQKLPYDVVFVLNRYFADMGAAVVEAGGHLDKFVGDGMMAIFGIDRPLPEACRQALAAAEAISQRLESFNRMLANELPEPFRMGMGLHAGPAIIGEVGYGAASGVTAIGDTVNTASRLEAAAKEFGAELVVSDEVARAAGADLSAFERRTIDVRGRAQQIGVHVIPKAAALADDEGRSASAGS